MLLAKDFSTRYAIVLERDATHSERYAAEELARMLGAITDAHFPIETGPTAGSYSAPPKRIVLGHGENAAALGITPDDTPGGEEYHIKTVGDDLVIAGGRPRGTLYGVYALLCDVLGCRFYTPEVSHIPKRRMLKLGPLDIRFAPKLEYREAWYEGARDAHFAARNRLNGNRLYLDAQHGGRVKYYKYFVHTFDKLIPTEEFFDTHPEYFSLVDGKRLREDTQLCLTNPDVFDIVLERMLGWMEDDPEATIFSLSQNDYYNPCQCDACRAIDEREGSHSGSLIWFVNKVAEAIEQQHPHVIIDTLAYQYTRPAPKHIRPRHNVCVRLCSIESCFGHPLDRCDVISFPFSERVKPGASFQNDLRDWARVCDRVYIWDYVTNFSHYTMPFPNLRVLGPNINFLIDNHARGIFEQGNYARGGGADFNELRTWLLAQLLWNPQFDVEAGIDEFMHAYYGHAAQPLLDYLNALHDKVARENIHFGIFDRHTAAYLDEETLSHAEACFERALALADDDLIRYRVERAYLTIRFVRLAHRVAGDHQRYLDAHPGVTECEPPAVTVSEETARDIRQFHADAAAHGLTRICEWRDLETTEALMLCGKLRLW